MRRSARQHTAGSMLPVRRRIPEFEPEINAEIGREAGILLRFLIVL